MSNRLINEQSVYLQQHAHNPVDWYPWGTEAFEAALQANKPIILSIGYSACHWCHVMERESFEDIDVAQIMNSHFVCIKVDREEHPDVDQLYMDAVQALGGHGGWPLNVFLTPGKEPFYGGTYFPPRAAYNRPSWTELLEHIKRLWADRNDDILAQAAQLVAHLRNASKPLTTASGYIFDSAFCNGSVAKVMKTADLEHGGFGNAPKFPSTMTIRYLLEHYYFFNDKDARNHALNSLDKMANGGIYDQLSGGFARYSTDRQWLAPHFEKMLYDNALLIMAYADAYALTHESRYKAIVEEIVDFVESELKDPAGGYYCALDADSEGVEGKFYTWDFDDWLSAIGDNAVLLGEYYGVSAAGNWEGTNILHIKVDRVGFCAKHNLAEAQLDEMLAEAKKKLLTLRNSRVRPQTDDKCLLSWNALMNTALSFAAKVTGSKELTLRASAHMEWMLGSYLVDDSIYHSWKGGVAKIEAKLDDLAYLIQSLIQLASITGSAKWLMKANYLTEVVIARFDAGTNFYYTGADAMDILVRKIENYDGATPSSNAIMADNLWAMGMCYEKSDWIERSRKMVSGMGREVSDYGHSFSYWAMLAQRRVVGLKTMVCNSIENEDLVSKINYEYLPHVTKLFAHQNSTEIPLLENKKSQGKLYIFVCSEEECGPPVDSIDNAFGLLGAHSKG